jgi:hypothetical protein
MYTSILQNLLNSQPETKVFDLQLVDGHCITPYDIYHVTPKDCSSYVRAVAFPGTERQYAIQIDKADVIDNLATGEITGSRWIDLEFDAPTTLSEALGAAIETKCLERKNEKPYL